MSSVPRNIVKKVRLGFRRPEFVSQFHWKQAVKFWANTQPHISILPVFWVPLSSFVRQGGLDQTRYYESLLSGSDTHSISINIYNIHSVWETEFIIDEEMGRVSLTCWASTTQWGKEKQDASGIRKTNVTHGGESFYSHVINYEIHVLPPLVQRRECGEWPIPGLCCYNENKIGIHMVLHQTQ